MGQITTADGRYVETVFPETLCTISESKRVVLVRGMTEDGERCVVLVAQGRALAFDLQTWDVLTANAGSFLGGWT
jgi:hypothetical protein